MIFSILPIFTCIRMVSRDCTESLGGVRWSWCSKWHGLYLHLSSCFIHTKPSLILSFYKREVTVRKWETYLYKRLCDIKLPSPLCSRPQPAWSRLPPRESRVVLEGSILTEATKTESVSRSFYKETKISELAHFRAHVRHHLAWRHQKQLKSLGLKVGWGLKPMEA